jgi:serine/threonine protein kinase/tetratricopeptide (TPR) repeat protein
VSPRPIPLGPFELLSPLGRGGMAIVWEGVHRGQGVPVAVKVITSSRARQQRFRRAFGSEVQAVASLEHPGIVMVLDHGEVTKEAQDASEGKLMAGSPYLAMELASWGSLDKVHTPLRWDDLVRTLLGLLDALAHAHARGVIHRDLKPGNVLMSAPTDVRPGLKLTDFGIAHALDHEVREGDESSGTPHFMAPEQFMGAWRDYGPWTDLYAVGCLSCVLASGKLPFSGDSAVQLAYAHLNRPPPDLEGAPEPFVNWVHRLMQKDPRDRYRHAADAGWALMRISDKLAKKKKLRGLSAVPDSPMRFVPTEVTEAAKEDTPPDLPTELEPNVDLEDGTAVELSVAAVRNLGAAIPTHDVNPLPPVTIVGDEGELATVMGHTRAGLTLPWVGEQGFTPASGMTPASVRPLSIGEVRAPPLAPRDLPPLPRTWRREQNVRVSMPLVGAGLGLYGLRAIPMVDRDEERDTIWSTLRTVREERTARAIVLRGAAGNGKSRVVEWMTQRANEVGSAHVLKAVHGPIAGPLDGIARMVARHLRCADLPRDKIFERTKKLLTEDGISDEYEWAALTELMSPAMTLDPQTQQRHVRFSNRAEQHVLVRRLLERLAKKRPVIVWLEDVQWGSDAVNFAAHMLRAQAQSPSSVLLLLTVRDEALEERPLETKTVADLAALPGCSSVQIAPLSKLDQERLVSELLVLDGELASQVADRTDGNPLFAIQLVGDWVQRGVLEVAESGFVLQRGEDAQLPDDIHQLWTRRINRVLGGQPKASRLALEVAATLGHEVEADEWQATVAEYGEQIPPLLLILLIEHRLAVSEGEAWSFAHGMLRESMERSAKERGRLQEHHRACARMLEARYGARAPGVPERLGRHYLAAREHVRALGPLLEGARARFATSEFAEALALIKLREEALEHLQAPEDDVRWGECWILRARINTVQGHFDAAQRWAERAERQAQRWNWQDILPLALERLAHVAHERGDQKVSIDRFEAAKALFERNEDHHGIAACILGVGEAVYRFGDLERAERYYEQALSRFEALDDAGSIAECLEGLGFVALWRGDVEEAASLFARDLALLESAGNRLKLARAVGAMGEAARQAGHLDEAEQHYRRALAIDEAIGSSSTWLDRLNLGLVLLARGEFEQAHQIIEAVRATLGERGEPSQMWAVHCQLLPTLAEKRDWDAWDQHYREGTRLLKALRLKDGDAAWLLALAGDRARLADAPVRARHVYEQALAQWQALGRPDKVAEVEEAIASLG